VDVVVTEGFAGNIALKTAEGTAHQLASYLRAGNESHMGRHASAICLRAKPSARCVTRWIRANRTVEYFLVSTAL
jgi:fatty acid/phospholipid biosynthesis enzyme